MLDRDQLREYLTHIRNIKRNHELFDIHVHPFEVIFGDQRYLKNTDCAGVYSSRPVSYEPPSIDGKKPSADMSASCRQLIKEDVRQKCLAFATRQLYQHTGPRVFEDLMDVSGIDRVLLLPVSGPGISIGEQMEEMFEMFGRHPRFSLGYSVPSTTSICDIEATIASAVARYGIRAVKVHPAITGIDLLKNSDRQHIEKIMLACRYNDLSMIVHGGRSSDVRPIEATEFSVLSRLELVDWGIAKNPVVIAHAGIYGYTEATLKFNIKSLRRILDQHENVMIDISAVSYPILFKLLNEVATDRIVFGSDALYFKQWTSLVALHHALAETYANADDEFIKIASLNAHKIIGEDVFACINS